MEANRGIGLETVRRLVGAGHRVYLGARDAERGRAAADSAGAELVELTPGSGEKSPLQLAAILVPRRLSRLARPLAAGVDFSFGSTEPVSSSFGRECPGGDEAGPVSSTHGRLTGRRGSIVSVPTISRF